MANTREHYRIPASQGPESEPCPRCEGTTLVRSDTGLCERCTALTAASQEAWRLWREECAERQRRKAQPYLDGHCSVCKQPWHAPTQADHDPYCPAKPLACECTRRFWDRSALNTHLRFKTCKRGDFYKVKGG